MASDSLRPGSLLPPYGIVSSIYYDTPDARSLREKLNSDYMKTKVRLRWYGDPLDPRADGLAFLEATYRIGGRRHKVHLPMPFSGCSLDGLGLDDPRLAGLPQRLRTGGHPVDPAIVPFIKIRYSLYRFIDRVSRVL